MDFQLKRETDIPLYIQVINLIREMIEKNIWTPGSKIPTERNLAQQLNISRNTVSMAFRELESEGVLVCQQGRGTFIAESDEAVRRESRKERLFKSIDTAIEEATTLGFSIEEFLAMTHVRSREKLKILSHVSIVLIECNREQVDYFAREMASSVGVIIQPILLGDLESDPDMFRFVLEKADIIITTLFHLQTVRKIVGSINTEIIALALSPLLDSIVRIARLPNGSNVGIFCTSSMFADKMIASLRSAGITHLRFQRFLTSSHPAEVAKQVAQVDNIITSPSRKQELSVHAKALGKGDVIEFIYSPDQASIDLLKSTVLELKQQNLKNWE
jgi:DNA-binding transcriptional regulator YhcF (GntR family)